MGAPAAGRRSQNHATLTWWCMADWSQRAALWDGPYADPGRGLSFVVMPPFIGEVA